MSVGSAASANGIPKNRGTDGGAGDGDEYCCCYCGRYGDAGMGVDEVRRPGDD